MKEPYFLDPALPQYVRKYMEENSAIDFEEMADYLMKNYQEFRSRKKKNFMKSVEKAYKWELYKRKQRTLEELSDDGECFDVDENGDDAEEIVEIPVEKFTPTEKKMDCPIDSLYRTPSSSSSNLVSSIVGTPTLSKGTKRKREVNKDLIIESELKKRKACIQKLTFQLDLSDFKGLQCLTPEICVIPIYLSGGDRKVFPNAILFSGPQGSGKSLLIEIFAGVCNVPIFRISTSSLNSGPVNNGISLLKEAFTEALENAPCILHIANIDDITSSKENGMNRGAEKKLCEQIIEELEVLKASNKTVLFVAETRKPQNIDTNLHNAFEKVIDFPVLGKEARSLILKELCEAKNLDISEVNLDAVVDHTTSFVAGDLKRLVKETCCIAVTRGSVSNLSKNINDYSSGKEFVNQYFRQVHQPKLQVLIDDFYTAFSRVTPTLKREGFPRPSDTKLDDIGGLEEIKEEIIDEILNPIKYKEDYDSFKIKSPVGVLMYGPPGCGKTLLAQAVANEAGVNLCPVRGPELLNMYQGESERAIRDVFQRAASVAPCIIFFDEFDSLCKSRSESAESGSRLTIVNTLLSEMDGFGEKKDIYILAATNYPEVIDPAILRAGRIDLFLYIGLPDTKSIEAIMKAFIKKSGIQIGSDVDLKSIAEQCKNFNGADCTRLVQLACKAAVKEARLNKSSDKNVYNRHFIIAKEKHKPSLSSKDRKRYLDMKIRMEGKWGEESSSS
ncbi:UNVERIFIED_CONTAM: hypothetical protein RMT77_000643 [Armadillidium vulgare]